MKVWQDVEVKDSFFYELIPALISGVVFGVSLTLNIIFFIFIWKFAIVFLPFLITSFIFFCCFFGRFIHFNILNNLRYTTITFVEKDKHNVWIIAADQGGGKSELTAHLTCIKSDYLEKKMNNEFLVLWNMKFKYKLDYQQSLDFEQLSDALSYYKSNPNVKACCSCNRSFIVDGKSNVDFSFKNMVQDQKTLIYTAVNYEEVSEDLSSDMSLKCPKIINRSCRFGRQFWELFIFANEQNHNKVLQQLRNVAINFIIEKREVLLAPSRYIKKLSKMQAQLQEKYPFFTFVFHNFNSCACRLKFVKIMKKKFKPTFDFFTSLCHLYMHNSILAKHCFDLNNKINNMGFVRYKLVGLNGTEGNVINPYANLTLVFPLFRRYNCASRGFRTLCESNKFVYNPYVYGGKNIDDSSFLRDSQSYRENWKKSYEDKEKIDEGVTKKIASKVIDDIVKQRNQEY